MHEVKKNNFLCAAAPQHLPEPDLPPALCTRTSSKHFKGMVPAITFSKEYLLLWGQLKSGQLNSQFKNEAESEGHKERFPARRK